MNSVFIAVSTAELARHSAFHDYLHLMDKPEKTFMGFSHGRSPAAGRNNLITTALESDCTHIFFVDDDMAFKPDILTRLLAHNKDVVSGYYLMHSYPHQGLIFDKEMEDGQGRWLNLNGQKPGLIEVTGTGLGCALFNLNVFKKLEKPWLRLGEIQKDEWCDDVGLYNRVRAAGFQVFVDLSVTAGHIGFVEIWPDYRDGWFVNYNTRGPRNLSMPAVGIDE